MSGFYSVDSVNRSLDFFQLTGKVVTSGTLKKRTTGDTFGTTVAWGSLYVYPQTSTSGLMGDGFPTRQTNAVMWRTGELYGPVPDDQVVIAGETYLVITVVERLNADVASNYAIYDLTLEDGVL